MKSMLKKNIENIKVLIDKLYRRELFLIRELVQTTYTGFLTERGGEYSIITANIPRGILLSIDFINILN